MPSLRPLALVRSCFLSGLCFTVFLVQSSELPLQGEEHLVYTTVDQADADFAFQGEYGGELKRASGETLKVGLQVVALGNGKYRAVAYHGGLPGEGWNQEIDPTPGTVEAERVGESIKFEGERGTGVVTPRGVDVFSPDGKKMGKLTRQLRTSPTMGTPPPAGAIVLFDGNDTSGFENGRMTEDKLLMQGVTSKQKFGDCQLHLEFILPYKPTARGQERGNSGCYLQGRYEVQVLDSFGLRGEDNECGGIYGVQKPRLNMCFPPLSWQTYDIDFTAARYTPEGKKAASAKLTVKQNGVLIHENVEIPDSTRAAPVKEGPDQGPLYLQDHGNPVRYRNIWIVEKKS